MKWNTLLYSLLFSGLGIFSFLLLANYTNLTPQEIAEKNGISVNTVRVHIKNAMDKMKEKLGSRIGILLFFLF